MRHNKMLQEYSVLAPAYSSQYTRTIRETFARHTSLNTRKSRKRMCTYRASTSLTPTTQAAHAKPDQAAHHPLASSAHNLLRGFVAPSDTAAAASTRAAVPSLTETGHYAFPSALPIAQPQIKAPQPLIPGSPQPVRTPLHDP